MPLTKSKYDRCANCGASREDHTKRKAAPGYAVCKKFVDESELSCYDPVENEMPQQCWMPSDDCGIKRMK